jgi:hypothetical protein
VQALILFLVIGLPAGAQVPRVDHRLIEVAHTNTKFSFPVYRTLDEWRDRQVHLRRQILSAAGLLPLPTRTPLSAMVFDRIDRGDYTIEKVLIETIPGYYLGGNLYRPGHRTGRFPAVLSPHGHWNRGRIENQKNYSVPALGVNLARQGYVVFAYDMAGYNDTKQTPHNFGGWREQLYGFTPMGLQLWNSIRAVDFVQSLPDVDPDRIGATGASGGGTQTFLLAAVDVRIRVAAPVNMISSIMQGGDPCEDAPTLRFDTSNPELAAVVAPRPMLIVSASGDWTRHTPEREYPAIQGIYKLFEKPELVQNAHFQAPHNYNRASREAVYQFFARYLSKNKSAINLTDRDFEPEKDEAMLAFPNGALPKGLDYEGVFAAWRRTTMQVTPPHNRAQARTALRYALGVEWPTTVWSEIEGERIALSRVGRFDRVNGLWFPGKGAPVVVVHSRGMEAARSSEAAKGALALGRPLLIVEPFNTGSTRDTRDRSDRYFLTYNRTENQNRVQDILTAMSWARSVTKGHVELVGLADAGIWCTFAAAVAPIPGSLTAETNGFQGREEDFHKRFFVPNILRAGGWEMASALAERRGKRLVQPEPTTLSDLEIRQPSPTQ